MKGVFFEALGYVHWSGYLARPLPFILRQDYKSIKGSAIDHNFACPKPTPKENYLTT